MRRLLPASTLLLVVLGACGDGSTTSTKTSTAVSSAATATGETTAGTAAGSATADSTGATTPAPPSNKPKVTLPTSLPTKLVITVLQEGTGEPAKAGDTVEVNYVGVRSADGTEFDNSYDRGQTFPVKLGAGTVIQGWDDGLVGAKSGSRIQLDIPSDLAYGDQDQGDVIKAGDALTFVIDVVSVTPGVDVPKANPADAPTVSVPLSTGATKITFEDLIVGTGKEAVADATAYVQIIGYDGATGKELQSTWTDGIPAELPLDAAQTLPGLVDGIIGMKVGGRRLVTIPFAEAFGEGGNESFGLPPSTDLIVVVDLVELTKAG